MLLLHQACLPANIDYESLDSDSYSDYSFYNTMISFLSQGASGMKKN